MIELLKEEGYSGDIKIVDIRNELNDRLHETGLLNEDKTLSSQRVMGWLDSLGFDKSPLRAQGYAHYVIDAKRLDSWSEDITVEKAEKCGKCDTLLDSKKEWVGMGFGYLCPKCYRGENESSPPPLQSPLNSPNLTKEEKSKSIEQAEKSRKVSFSEESEVPGGGGEGKIIDQKTRIRCITETYHGSPRWRETSPQLIDMDAFARDVLRHADTKGYKDINQLKEDISRFFGITPRKGKPTDERIKKAVLELSETKKWKKIIHNDPSRHDPTWMHAPENNRIDEDTFVSDLLKKNPELKEINEHHLRKRVHEELKRIRGLF